MHWFSESISHQLTSHTESKKVAMKITINGQDYTPALDNARPLTIERKLNEPTYCQLWLGLPTSGNLAMPVLTSPWR